MPSREDAINAIMVLKDLSDTEQEFLTRLVSNPQSVPDYELESHANVIKALLGSQTALLYILMNQMADVDDKIGSILEKFEE